MEFQIQKNRKKVEAVAKKEIRFGSSFYFFVKETAQIDLFLMKNKNLNKVLYKKLYLKGNNIQKNINTNCEKHKK